MDIKENKTILKILLWCIEDDGYSDFWALFCFVEEFYKSINDLEKIQDIALHILYDLINKKLLIAGKFKNKVFIPSNINLNELIIELKNKWNKLKDKKLPVDLVDFKITEKGRREFEYLNSLPKLQETDPFYNDE